MKRLLLVLGFSSTAWARPEVLETPHSLISVEHHCPEGCVSCADGVTYIGKNKATGKLISLRGGTAHSHSADGTPAQFWGYIFKQGATTYFVGADGSFEVKEGDKLLIYEKGEWKR
jgi:hypothetical protein